MEALWNFGLDIIWIPENNERGVGRRSWERTKAGLADQEHKQPGTQFLWDAWFLTDHLCVDIRVQNQLQSPIDVFFSPKDAEQMAEHMCVC